MKKVNVDYQSYKENWKNFFVSKGFKVSYDEDDVVCLTGCHPAIQIEIYAGNFREDTKTGGCICGDFVKTFNKISQCPIYFDLHVSEEDVWKAIEMLIGAGIEFSRHFGHIEYQSGQLNYNPPLYNKKEKVYCRK